MAGYWRLLKYPIIINPKNNLIVLIAGRKGDELHMRATQKVHDLVIEDTLLMQLSGCQGWIIGLGLIMLKQVFLNIIAEIICLNTPCFVFGINVSLVNCAKQKARQNTNNGHHDE